jgi:imidazole glycerol-phosphate synthase subunit HisH
MLALINYGMGNLRSISNAFDLLGKEVLITDDPDEISKSEGIILPGVGSFSDGIQNLKRKNMVDILEKEVLINKKPYLGICLGLEFLAERSYEGGSYEGFGWINGSISKIEPKSCSFKVPHIGWDDTEILKNDELFNEIQEPTFYYLHSYFFDVSKDDKKYVTSVCDYGGVEIPATIHKDNIFATQFHPEKSQETGLKLLNNFLEYVKK